NISYARRIYLKACLIHQLFPMPEAADIFISNQDILFQLFIPYLNDPLVTTPYKQLQLLDHIGAVFFHNDQLTTRAQTFMQNMKRLVDRFKMMQGVLNQNLIERAGRRMAVKKVLVTTREKSGIAVTVPVSVTFLHLIEIKFQRRAMRFDPIHGEKQTGSAVSATTIPDGLRRIINHVSHIPKPL